MRRRSVITLIALGIIIFLVISGLLARAFSVSGAEQSAISDLIQAEAAGDTPGVVSLITGCRSRPGCPARAAALVGSLRHPGHVSIIQLQASSNFSLGATLGTARVAWIAGSSLPRVQCVRVHHAGNVLRGFRIELLQVTPKLRSDAVCPSRFGSGAVP